MQPTDLLLVLILIELLVEQLAGQPIGYGVLLQYQLLTCFAIGETTSHLTKLSKNDSKVIGYMRASASSAPTQNRIKWNHGTSYTRLYYLASVSYVPYASAHREKYFGQIGGGVGAPLCPRGFKTVHLGSSELLKRH